MRTFAGRRPNGATAHSASNARSARQETAVARFSRPVGSAFPFGLSHIPPARPPLQTKLSVDRPGDRFEREADTVADKVMRMIEPGPLSPAPAAVQRKCRQCADEVSENGTSILAAAQGIMGRDEEMTLFEEPEVEEPEVEEPEETLQRNAEPRTAAGPPSPFVAERLTRAQAGGEPLAPAPRQRMEAAFGRDFSNVRIHRDGEAAELTRQLAARAFTYAGHVYFGSGNYDPTGAAGQRLLAHELTHVVQQGHAAPVGERQARPGAESVGAATPAIQRVATWGNHVLRQTNNLAHQILTGGAAGQTDAILNGRIKGALNAPTVTVKRARRGGYNASVSAVPTNVIGADETVLSAGPWSEITTKAAFGARFGNPPQCSGAGDCTFRAEGDPDDAAMQTANRRHEDKHVADGLAAFNTHIVPWDAKLTAAEQAGTVYHGRTRAAARAALFTALGGTEVEARNAFSRDWNAAQLAYHNSQQGQNVSLSAVPTIAADCSTASAKFTNPS